MALEIYFDGLCRPSSGGIATYGYIIREDKKEIKSGKGFVGKGDGMTQNVAEYCALLEALKWLKALDIDDEIIIKGDSKLIIHQLSGRWKIKSKTSKEFIPKIYWMAKNSNLSGYPERRIPKLTA